MPLDWAATQMNLGAALWTLGARESGTARLEEAVGAYRAALEEYTRERVPLDWAMTQMNLGNALRTVGERESGTARLEEAVGAYRAALEEYTRERVPLDWAPIVVRPMLDLKRAVAHAKRGVRAEHENSGRGASAVLPGREPVLRVPVWPPLASLREALAGILGEGAPRVGAGRLSGVVAPGIVKGCRLPRRLDVGDQFGDPVIWDRIVKWHRRGPRGIQPRAGASMEGVDRLPTRAGSAAPQRIPSNLRFQCAPGLSSSSKT